MFWVFGHNACGILALWPGLNTYLLHSKVRSYPLDSQGSPSSVFIHCFLLLLFFFNNVLISHSSFLLENNSLVSGLAEKSLGYRMRSVMSYTRLCVWSVSPILFSPFFISWFMNSIFSNTVTCFGSTQQEVLFPCLFFCLLISTLLSWISSLLLLSRFSRVWLCVTP